HLRPTNSSRRVSIGKSSEAKSTLDVDGAISLDDYLGINAYYDGGWKRINSGHAMVISIQSDTTKIYLSTASDSAGSAITFNSIDFDNANGTITAENFILK
ncbi:MAG: hypothetical protein ACOC2U_00100, partial [bacterium]